MDIQPIRNKWKGTMTDRERFRRQMHYESVDRCFNMEFGYWEENYTQWDVLRNNNIEYEWQANELFAFDKLDTVGGPVWTYPPFPYTVLEETDAKVKFVDANGLICEKFKNGASSIPHYIGSTVNTPEDWDRVKKERFDVNHPARTLDIEALKKQFPNDRDYPLTVHTGSMIGYVRDLLTFEGLCYAIYDYPEMVEDMVETSCQLVEHELDQLLGNIQFDAASGWEDICFKNGPIVSVDFFRDIVAPRYKRINEKLKKHGIDIWYIDCDGDVRPILPYFLESGVNCLFPYEVAGCAHPAELLKEYGKDLRIMGGFDKLQMIKGKDEIKRYMDSIAPLVERGGYIPFCDHRCPPDVTEENYFYYLDLKEEYFSMK
ncbi:MAG: hypothetical protein E7315_00470 [Clostridiales bacterium]|nr:hypothetical protein [Clostridiales bacterium]